MQILCANVRLGCLLVTRKLMKLKLKMSQHLCRLQGLLLPWGYISFHCQLVVKVVRVFAAAFMAAIKPAANFIAADQERRRFLCICASVKAAGLENSIAFSTAVKDDETPATAFKDAEASAVALKDMTIGKK